MSDIIYGRRLTDNKIISINEVPSNMVGLSCNCVCAYCGRHLQACSLQGKVSRYFRHDNGRKNIEHDWVYNCSPTTANETALHKMAKQIIAEEKKVLIPRKCISLAEAGIDDLPKEITNRIPNFEFQKDIMVCAETVELEKRLEKFSPDVLLRTKKGELLVEIFVSHQVDENKKAKAVEYGAAMLEIDLREFTQTPISTGDLRNILIDSTNNKKWIYYPLTDSSISKARLFYEENGLVREYRKLLEESNKKIKRDEYEKKRRNHKIKDLFQPQAYESKLRNLRNDSSFFEFYKKFSRPFWYRFDLYYQKNNRVPFFVDIPISGEMIFKCDRRIWQSAIFNRYIYGRKEVGKSFLVEKIFDVLKDDYEVPIDYDLSYKLINPLDEEKTIRLRKEVIDKYIGYLETIGFISNECYHSYSNEGTWVSVKANKTIQPPNEKASECLVLVLNNVNQYSPNINQLVNEKMSEYQGVIQQEAIEKHSKLMAERARKIREANGRYAAEMKARAEQEEQERQNEILLQKQREEEQIREIYNNGLRDVETFDFSKAEPRYDRYGNRWARCIVCNCIKREEELVSYLFGTGECNVCRKD